MVKHYALLIKCNEFVTNKIYLTLKCQGMKKPIKKIKPEKLIIIFNVRL